MDMDEGLAKGHLTFLQLPATVIYKCIHLFTVYSLSYTVTDLLINYLIRLFVRIV